MNTTSEIAPFFGASADPSLFRSAAEILRQLRTSRTEVTEFRSALPAISALLACERYGTDIVSKEAAQKSSATTRAQFSAGLSKCRRILSSYSSLSGSRSSGIASPSGRRSMARAGLSTPPAGSHKSSPKSQNQSQQQFDPLNLPGSSAKKVAPPVMRRSGRDLSGLVKNKAAVASPDKGKAPEKGKTVDKGKAPETGKASDKDKTFEQEKDQTSPTTPTKNRSSTSIIPSPSPAPPTPTPPLLRTPRKAAAPPTPNPRLTRTPTGQGSPMHNALMKNRIEGASAARLASARKGAAVAASVGRRGAEKVFEEEEDDEQGGELPSPKRRRVEGSKITNKTTTPKDTTPTAHDQPYLPPDSLTARPAISAHKINTLFAPLPTHPLDPQTSIPAPPLVFHGPTIFQRPPVRIFERMVPSEDRAFGDAYSLMGRRREGSDVAVLEIGVGEVGDAVEKRERARKRRVKRLERVSRGFGRWDREFGVPVDVDDAGDVDVPDWEERLEVYNATIPGGTQSVIDSLAKRAVPATDVDVDVLQDTEWISRAETHGIAIRVYKDT